MIKYAIVDSCVWIDFLSKNKGKELIKNVSDNYVLCINDAIKAEVIPHLLHQKENRAADLLASQVSIPLNIDWDGIVSLQLKMLKSGINKVGVIDLIIIQNAIQNKCAIASIDKHFKLMCSKLNIELVV